MIRSGQSLQRDVVRSDNVAFTIEVENFNHRKEFQHDLFT